mmetsp:Transcript_54056/g.144830  ORF Transcript_54056/g.144830 Transcript_54056/m.144830 type:complete len:292 (-) Transcript_54056:8-883(-)
MRSVSAASCCAGATPLPSNETRTCSAPPRATCSLQSGLSLHKLYRMTARFACTSGWYEPALVSMPTTIDMVPAASTAALQETLPPERFLRTPTTWDLASGVPLRRTATSGITPPSLTTASLLSAFFEVRLCNAQAACSWHSENWDRSICTSGGMAPARATATRLMPVGSTLALTRLPSAPAIAARCWSGWAPGASSVTASSRTVRSRHSRASSTGGKGEESADADAAGASEDTAACGGASPASVPAPGPPASSSFLRFDAASSLSAPIKAEAAGAAGVSASEPASFLLPSR